MWKRNIPLVDTNIALRYILGDNPELSPKARDILDNNIVEVPIEVIPEIIYALQKGYKISRDEIAKLLPKFFDDIECIVPQKAIILKALEVFASTSLDFVDCILAASAILDGRPIITFDVKLQKFINRQMEVYE
ncbi:MAG: PIN domain-containing protein [Clostridiales bacterium]|jgi:predicted nucleic-acid-binding protein|nr:PIN domain-containing protein [Clostridiales bacterium]